MGHCGTPTSRLFQTSTATDSAKLANIRIGVALAVSTVSEATDRTPKAMKMVAALLKVDRRNRRSDLCRWHNACHATMTSGSADELPAMA